MDQAGIVAEGDILGSMRLVLDEPVAAFERQEPLGRADGGWQAGDAIAYLLVLSALLPPGALQAEDLGDPGPIGKGEGIGGGNQEPVIDPAMALLQGGSTPTVQEGSRLGTEDAGDGVMQLPLVDFDGEQVVPTTVADLLAEVPLAVEGVAGQHPSLPIHLVDQSRGDGEFGLRRRGVLLHRLLDQDAVLLGTEG